MLKASHLGGWSYELAEEVVRDYVQRTFWSMSISTQKTMLKDYAKRNGFLNCQFYVDV